MRFQNMQHASSSRTVAENQPGRAPALLTNKTSPRKVPCWEVQGLITWRKWMEAERISAT